MITRWRRKYLWLLVSLKRIEEMENGRISFAIEGRNGYGSPIDRILIGNSFTLYNVDNLKRPFICFKKKCASLIFPMLMR